MKLHLVSFILVIVGALNWGLVGIGHFTGNNLNIVNLILGAWPTVEVLVYILVGIAAIYELVSHKKNCKCCERKGGM